MTIDNWKMFILKQTHKIQFMVVHKIDDTLLTDWLASAAGAAAVATYDPCQNKIYKNIYVKQKGL